MVLKYAVFSSSSGWEGGGNTEHHPFPLKFLSAMVHNSINKYDIQLHAVANIQKVLTKKVNTSED